MASLSTTTFKLGLNGNILGGISKVLKYSKIHYTTNRNRLQNIVIENRHHATHNGDGQIITIKQYIILYPEILYKNGSIMNHSTSFN